MHGSSRLVPGSHRLLLAGVTALLSIGLVTVSGPATAESPEPAVDAEAVLPAPGATPAPVQSGELDADGSTWNTPPLTLDPTAAEPTPAELTPAEPAPDAPTPTAATTDVTTTVPAAPVESSEDEGDAAAPPHGEPTAPVPTVPPAPVPPETPLDDAPSSAPLVEPVVVAAPAPSPGTPVVFRVSAPSGSTAECRLARDGVLLGEWAACDVSPQGSSYDTGLTGDGSYRLEVRLTDPAGSVGPTASGTDVRDTEEPAAPVVTGPAAHAGGAGAPVWTWVAEPGSATACTLTRGTAVVLTGPCTSPLAVPLPQDGVHVLSVTALDTAGNASVAGTASYVRDTDAPDRPVVLGPRSPSRSTTPVLGVDAEPGVLVECRLADGSPDEAVPAGDGWTPCPQTPLQVPTGAAATYRLEVRATDAAGNSSAPTALLYAYDPTAPDGLLELALPRTTDATRTPQWSWAPPAGGAASCALTGPQGLVERRPCSTGFQPSAPLATEGRHVLSVAVADGARVATHDLLFVLDTTGPDAPPVTPSGTTGRLGQVSWGWPQAPATTWECQLERAGRVLTGFRPCSPGSQLLGEWGEGAYVLSVRGVDPAGNRGAVGQGRYTWTSAGPAALGVTTTSPTRGPSRVRWSFVVPPEAVAVSCGVRREGEQVRDLTDCRGGYPMDLAGQQDGLYEVVVRFTDATGDRTDQVRAYVLSAAVAGVRAQGTPAAVPPASLTGSQDGGPAPSLARPVPVTGPVAGAPVAPADVDALPERSVPVVGDSPSGARGVGAGRPRRAEDLVIGAGAVDALRGMASETIKRPQLPIALLLLVLAFLLVQSRIDRRDPKLAGARIDADEQLEFHAWPASARSAAHLPGPPPEGGAPA